MLRDVLLVEGRPQVASLLLLFAAGLLLVAARPRGLVRRRGWLSPSSVIAASLSCLALLTVEVQRFDARGVAMLGVAAVVLAVAGRRRCAVVVARRDVALDRLRGGRARRRGRRLS